MLGFNTALFVSANPSLSAGNEKKIIQEKESRGDSRINIKRSLVLILKSGAIELCYCDES